MRKIIEDIIWEYKRTLNVDKTVEKFLPVLKDLTQVKETVKFIDPPKEKLRSVSLENILTKTCEVFDIPREHVGHSPTHEKRKARYAYSFLAHEIYGHSHQDTVNFIGLTDHTASVYACRKHRKLFEENLVYSDKFLILHKQLKTEVEQELINNKTD